MNWDLKFIFLVRHSHKGIQINAWEIIPWFLSWNSYTKFDNKFALHTIVTCLQNALHLAFLVTSQWLHEACMQNRVTVHTGFALTNHFSILLVKIGIYTRNQPSVRHNSCYFVWHTERKWEWVREWVKHRERERVCVCSGQGMELAVC